MREPQEIQDEEHEKRGGRRETARSPREPERREQKRGDGETEQDRIV